MIYTYDQLIQTDLNNRKSTTIDDIVESLCAIDNKEKIDNVLLTVSDDTTYNKKRKTKIIESLKNKLNKQRNQKIYEACETLGKSHIDKLINDIEDFDNDFFHFKFVQDFRNYIKIDCKSYHVHQKLIIANLWTRLYCDSIIRCLTIDNKKNKRIDDFHKMTNYTAELSIMLRKQGRIEEAKQVWELSNPEPLECGDYSFKKILDFSAYTRIWKKDVLNEFMIFSSFTQKEANKVLNQIVQSVKEALIQLHNIMDKNLYNETKDTIKSKSQKVNYSNTALRLEDTLHKLYKIYFEKYFTHHYPYQYKQ